MDQCIIQVVSAFVYDEGTVDNIVGAINQGKQKFYSGNILYAI